MKKKIGKIDNKELLKSKRLLVLKNSQIVYETNNIQSLYLYPLNILEYIKYASMKKTLMYNILDIEKCDFNTIINDDIKNIEFLISDYNLKNIKQILILSKILKEKNIYVSYNLKTLNIEMSDFIKLCKLGDYFKITFYNILEKDIEYRKFLMKIKTIKEKSKCNAMIHIKGYLSIKQVTYYARLIKDLQNYVDIIQISKELMPISLKINPSVDPKVQKYIRILEEQNEKFISVKDISTLYYPRFELDERNSHQCYVWYLKPYIKGNTVLPCKVNEIIKNINKWRVKNLYTQCLNKNIDKYGKLCNDCASIYENDILAEISCFFNGDYDFLLEIDEK